MPATGSSGSAASVIIKYRDNEVLIAPTAFTVTERHSEQGSAHPGAGTPRIRFPLVRGTNGWPLPARLTTAVRSLIGRVDSNVGIDALLPMDQLVASSLTRQRFYAAVMGGFAAIAALLSVVGIYGVLAY